MHWINYIGYLGSILSSVSFLPQVIKAWKTKSVIDLSVWMILFVITSTMLWLIYGLGIQSGPVIVANTIVLILSFLLLYFKIKFKN